MGVKRFQAQGTTCAKTPMGRKIVIIFRNEKKKKKPKWLELVVFQR